MLRFVRAWISLFSLVCGVSLLATAIWGPFNVEVLGIRL